MVSDGTITINRSDSYKGLIVNAKGGIESDGNIVSNTDIKASNEIFVKDKNLFKSGLVGCPPKFYDQNNAFYITLNGKTKRVCSNKGSSGPQYCVWGDTFPNSYWSTSTDLQDFARKNKFSFKTPYNKLVSKCDDVFDEVLK